MALQPSKSIENRQRHLTVLTHEISLMAARIFNRRVKDVGLTRPQWHVLYLLNEQDGQTQTELADSLAMAKPPLGKVVDRLEEDGWIERKSDPKDRRAKRVFLTQKIRPFVDPLVAIVDEIGEIETRGLSKLERETFIKLLHIVHENLAGEVDAQRD